MFKYEISLLKNPKTRKAALLPFLTVVAIWFFWIILALACVLDFIPKSYGSFVFVAVILSLLIGGCAYDEFTNVEAGRGA